MNTRKPLILLALMCFLLPFLCGAQEEEVLIPPEAHQKAIETLQALGPERGSKKIDYSMVSIIGVVKGIERHSTAIETAIKDLGAQETEAEIQIELSGDVLFDFDEWDIRFDAETMLKKVGDIITAYKSPKVIIAGHTDSKGSEAYNLRLSEKRSESVKKWLSENAGISAHTMKTIGYGETRPVAQNANSDGLDNPEGRQKNRRVDIVIKKK
ncbi:MAG: OmpA family protein [Deltaproteobacteria bacterium]|nr:OmpA family protein [Deltaproteobacteria bacterium]MBW1719159.1 OmpA family protein [Deltaproteobacteria bacterium]MBW1932988.1 OmpA family protein [Deltaproteobacteria bacterium]MBW1938801.1 OmpA family protein [Deltaproteobacteria bacterium]MBW1964867.1 OmpA family protein [Deltaproteobacteria bacterium]